VQEIPKIVDLFAGCGGFALGAHAAGLAPVLAIDIDPILTSSFSANFPKIKLKLADISEIRGSDIEREVGGRVDGIFGGPPCQAFSDIGQRKLDDPRRSMVSHFFRLVADLRPGFFVMENVKGLGYADSRPVLDAAIEQLPESYSILGPIILDALSYGAATRRPRLFVLGFDTDRISGLQVSDIEAHSKPPSTIRAAIADLMSAVQVGDEDGFDVWRLTKAGRPSRYSSQLRTPRGVFTGHIRTLHTPAVAARFAAVPPGEVDEIGRHPRLHWDGHCPTLRAGTGNDRGSFQSVRPIHPQENRVITVREAARLQGFPDGFRFHPTVWHSFRMIGNSVSPFMSAALFRAIASRIERTRLPIAAE
jgi:DNA (cytosine-5)-methyltransferase 1